MKKHKELENKIKEYVEIEKQIRNEILKELEKERYITARDILGIKKDIRPKMFILGYPAKFQLSNVNEKSPLIVDIGFLSNYDDFRYVYGSLTIPEIIELHKQGMVLMLIAETDVKVDIIRDEKLLNDYIYLFEYCINNKVPAIQALNYLLPKLSNNRPEDVENIFYQSMDLVSKSGELTKIASIYSIDQEFRKWWIDEFIFVTAFDLTRVWSLDKRKYEQIINLIKSKNLSDGNYAAHLACKFLVNKHINSIDGFPTFVPVEYINYKKLMEKVKKCKHVYVEEENRLRRIESVLDGEVARYLTNPVLLACPEDIEEVEDVSKQNERVVKERYKMRSICDEISEHIQKGKDKKKVESCIKKFKKHNQRYIERAEDLKAELGDKENVIAEEPLILGELMFRVGERGVVELAVGKKFMKSAFNDKGPNSNSIGITQIVPREILQLETRKIKPVHRNFPPQERIIWNWWSDKAWVAFMLRH